jgi:glycosyltransferase involved in cell wall biosynthesis
VERGNADALAEAILRLLSDENLSQEMGKAGRQRVVDKFSWEQISETLLVEFQKICDPTC